jgi:coproporphyrinogen III oxidase
MVEKYTGCVCFGCIFGLERQGRVEAMRQAIAQRAKHPVYGPRDRETAQQREAAATSKGERP